MHGARDRGDIKGNPALERAREMSGDVEFMKHRVLFVCHGNICRPTMAGVVFQDMAKRRRITSPAMTRPA